jgi:hypothetical protein
MICATLSADDLDRLPPPHPVAKIAIPQAIPTMQVLTDIIGDYSLRQLAAQVRAAGFKAHVSARLEYQISGFNVDHASILTLRSLCRLHVLIEVFSE